MKPERGILIGSWAGLFFILLTLSVHIAGYWVGINSHYSSLLSPAVVEFFREGEEEVLFCTGYREKMETPEELITWIHPHQTKQQRFKLSWFACGAIPKVNQNE